MRRAARVAFTHFHAASKFGSGTWSTDPATPLIKTRRSDPFPIVRRHHNNHFRFDVLLKVPQCSDGNWQNLLLHGGLYVGRLHLVRNHIPRSDHHKRLLTTSSSTHYKTFDGSFHRPKNQEKKKRKKAEAEAEAAKEAEKAAEKKARKEARREAQRLADEVASEAAHRRHRRRDDTPAPRAHDGRRGSRAHDERDRYRNERHGDGRYSDSSSWTSSYNGSRPHYSNVSSRRHASHSDFEHRVKPTPHGEYVPEASVRRQKT